MYYAESVMKEKKFKIICTSSGVNNMGKHLSQGNDEEVLQKRLD